MVAEHKRCTKCDKEKALGEFSKRARSKDGLQPNCKDCNAKWRAENRERRAEYQAKYCAENRKRKAEYDAKRNAENRERKAEINAKWYAENRERKAEYAAKYRAENPDVQRAANARRRARKANAPHEPYSRSEVFDRYAGTCAYCDAPAEHLDHVVAISRGGADAAHNLLPACAPCNLSKSDKSLADWALTFGA